jgi:hypothetical protein
MSKRVLIINPGEKVILPKDTIIEAIVIDGSISVESSCDNLPTPSTFKCGYFTFTLDADDNPDHPWDMNTQYSKLIVGDTQYDLSVRVGEGDNNHPVLNPADFLNQRVPSGLIEFLAIDHTDKDQRYEIDVKFKIPEILFDQIQLEMNERGEGRYYYLKPLEMDCP